jgi:hypothetical protein
MERGETHPPQQLEGFTTTSSACERASEIRAVSDPFAAYHAPHALLFRNRLQFLE